MSETKAETEIKIHPEVRQAMHSRPVLNVAVRITSVLLGSLATKASIDEQLPLVERVRDIYNFIGEALVQTEALSTSESPKASASADGK